MSNARKLQTEIERCMKKVDEGVELFDEIWEKVYSAEQQNQKEKYEMDLKKEIKKLQRQRDQIKTWISSSEVKDKDPLIEARKLIESKMEQFKICEKETKTKTYSKEGLAREDKLDPEEEAKLNTTTWLGEYIDRFMREVEEKDFDIQKLQQGKTKKAQKAQLEALLQHVANHKFHISKLEGIIRLVNNDRLDCALVDPLREDLDYYLDSYQDEDYAQAYDEEYFYESLGLEDMDVVNVDRVTQSSGSVRTNKGLDDATSTTSSRASRDTSKKSSKSKPGMASAIPLMIGRARSKPEKSNGTNSAAPNTTAAPAPAPAPPATTTTAAEESSAGSSKPTPTKPARAPPVAVKSALAPTPVPTQPPAIPNQPPGTSMAAILKRETEQQEKERQQKLLREQQAKAEQLRQQQQQQQQQQLAQQRQQQQQEALRQQEAMRLKQQQEAQAAAEQLRQQQRQQEEAAKLRQQQLQQQQESAKQQQQQQQLQQQSAASQPPSQQQQQRSLGEENSISAATPTKQPQSNTNPGLGLGQLGGPPQAQPSSAMDILTSGLGGLGLGGVAPSAAASERSQQQPQQQQQQENGRPRPSSFAASALNESFAAVPSPADHERSYNYVPQNPYPNTPPSYPSTPSAIFEKPEIFEKLGTDALFFIFYYAQGSYQQYLAARELKKQSWRFHKKYMTWFQRHEEPQITTDEYEQGTYVYFDYETGWCTRIKTDFRFEYSFLEDTLQ